MAGDKYAGMVRLFAALLIALAPASARGLESAPVSSPRATATLVSASEAVAPGERLRLALRLVLAPGWHTYWKNAGDAGAAPELALTLPEGGAATPLAFPTPKRVPYGPLVNFGYTGEVLFPLAVTVPALLAPGDRFVVEAAGSWLVCAEVCIPEEGVFRLDLPVADAAVASPGGAALLRSAEAALPRPIPFSVTVGFEGGRGALTVAGEGIAPGAVREAFFFPADPGLLDHAAAQTLALREGALTLALARGPGAMPASVEGVLALTDAAGVKSGYLVTAAPTALPVGALAGSPTGAERLGLGMAILFALAGGLILNLMPCVFPILAMKALALACLGGVRRAEVRWHAAAYTAGVVLSFLALGGVLVALRLAGVAAGWGIQFTEPVLVAALAWLMLAVGLNLSGVYAVGGPVGLGQDAAARGGRAGAFFTGALAVIVATPCTAPFMAAAIGAAAAMPPAWTLAVFATLGLGMALPYALIGLAPGLARALPRPGAWMERLKQGLAFPMYAAAAWLVWVVAQGAGPDSVLAVLAGGVLIGFALWALGAAQRASGGFRQAGRGMAAGGIAGALLLLPLAAAPPQAAAQRVAVTALAGAEPWSPDRVAELRAQGRPVFVNLTAAWCISCKVNERIALDTEAVRSAFAARGVAVLVGDWTRGDPAITALLRAHQRDGVPLYLLYPPHAGSPTVLPQLLTEGIVLEALGALPAPVAAAAGGPRS